MPEIKQDIRAATIIVAANGSLHKNDADYVCDGVNDHIEINTAIVEAAALGGGEVRLLEGTYYIESSIVLDSNITLRGCGRNTILTTTTADLDIITATGGAGAEKIGILLADFCVDGNAGGVANDCGILWTYVDYSKIRDIWSQNNGQHGISIDFSDFNEITDNICVGNGDKGIHLGDVTSCTFTGNICQGNSDEGIHLASVTSCTLTGNICQGNGGYGIWCYANSNNNIITGNTCGGNSLRGIYILRSSYCTITGNNCNGNTGATADGICVQGIVDNNADYNTITGNVCTDNGDDGTKIAGGAYANKNIVAGNQLLGNTGSPLVDGGTDTEIGHNITT